MELFKIICISKDEDELIEDWILYHGYIAGYKNIILLDNMSKNPNVLEIYKKYQEKGMILHSIPSFHGNSQGDYTTKFINMYKDQCKWFIPLDTDEFLFSDKHLKEGLDPTEREHIYDVIRNIPDDITCGRISYFPQSEVDTSSVFYKNFKVERPARNMTFFSKDVQKSKVTHWYYNCIKSIGRTNAFNRITNGNHGIYPHFGKTSIVQLGYFHFHSTGSRELFDRAARHIYAQNYVNPNDSLVTQINKLVRVEGPGHHRIWQYTNIKTREFIIQKYIEYHNSLPSSEKLDELTNFCRNKNANTIQEYIKTCEKGVSNFLSDEDIPNLIFYEEPLNKENIVEYNWLAKRLQILG